MLIVTVINIHYPTGLAFLLLFLFCFINVERLICFEIVPPLALIDTCIQIII